LFLAFKETWQERINKMIYKQFRTCTFLVAILTFCFTGSAKEWVSTEAGISFQIPDDPSWHQGIPPNPQVKFLIERTEKTAEVFFAVDPAPPNQQVLNQEFITGFEKGYWPQGKSLKRTGEFSEFKGKKVYKTSGDLFIKEVVFKKAAIVWIENGKAYIISTIKRGSDPSEDSVIKNFLATAKFTSKP
jgi:hypothetical protein